MTEQVRSKQTHWGYWAGGTLFSLATIGAAPMDLTECSAMGVVTLLFFWGTLAAERMSLLWASANEPKGPANS